MHFQPYYASRDQAAVIKHSVIQDVFQTNQDDADEIEEHESGDEEKDSEPETGRVTNVDIGGLPSMAATSKIYISNDIS